MVLKVLAPSELPRQTSFGILGRRNCLSGCRPYWCSRGRRQDDIQIKKSWDKEGILILPFYGIWKENTSVEQVGLPKSMQPRQSGLPGLSGDFASPGWSS